MSDVSFNEDTTSEQDSDSGESSSYKHVDDVADREEYIELSGSDEN